MVAILRILTLYPWLLLIVVDVMSKDTGWTLVDSVILLGGHVAHLIVDLMLLLMLD